MVIASTFFQTQHGLIMLINFAGHELLLWVSCFFPIGEALEKAHAFLKDSMLLLTNHTLIMIRNFAGPNNNCLFYPLSRFQKLQNCVIRHFDLIHAICGLLTYLLRNTLDMMRNYARPILRRCRYFSLFNRLKERNLKLRHFHEDKHIISDSAYFMIKKSCWTQ